HDLRADPFRHARAQPSALPPLVGAAADRFPSALQQRLPRRDDELFVRDRARTLGAHKLGGAARAGADLASDGIDAVRAGAVFLPPIRGWSLRAWSARLRAATALGDAPARVAG